MALDLSTTEFLSLADGVARLAADWLDGLDARQIAPARYLARLSQNVPARTREEGRGCKV